MALKETRKKISPEVLAKIKNITLFTRRMLKNHILGNTKSNIKGMGFDFDSLRDYQIGDDIRFMDWQASSRSSSLLVKEFFQEKNNTVMLIVDVSASVCYGTITSKFELVSQIASAIALIALQTKDALGLILFSDRVELYVPPSRGHNWINQIIELLFSWTPQGRKTSSSAVFECLMSQKKKKGLIFWFSDCIDQEFSTVVKKLPHNHDVYVMRCLDRLERSFPAIGTLWLEDIESGDMHHLSLHEIHDFYLQNRLQEQNMLIQNGGCTLIEVHALQEALQRIIALFGKRSRM